MKKSSKLWVYPLSIFMIALGILDLIADPRLMIVFGDEPRKVYAIIYGLVFIAIGIYYLMVIFLYDTRDDEGEASFKDILSAFAMFAIPSFFLCLIGYLKIVGELNHTHSVLIDDYDIYSYAQFIFAILCFYLFYISYPKLKLRNLLLVLSALMILGSGFMQLFAYTDLLFYTSYVVYSLGIITFGFSCYLNDQHYS